MENQRSILSQFCVSTEELMAYVLCVVWTLISSCASVFRFDRAELVAGSSHPTFSSPRMVMMVYVLKSSLSFSLIKTSFRSPK